MSETLVKHDQGKLRWCLVPVLAMREVVKVLMVGALKYGDWNWLKGTFWSRYYDALQRHATAYWSGEDQDQEDGIWHLAHLICCALFLLTYQILKLGTDDRPTSNKSSSAPRKPKKSSCHVI